jgi:hypothetical protein
VVKMVDKDYDPNKKKIADIKAMAFDEIEDAFKSMDKKHSINDLEKEKV